MRDWAVDRGEEGDLAFVLVILSWLETRAGDLAAATSVAEQAEMYARADRQSGDGGAVAVAQQAFIAAHEGDEARTRDAAARATSLGGQLDFLLPGAWSTASLALLEMSLGNAEAAWRACEDHVALLEALGIPEPILVLLPPRRARRADHARPVRPGRRADHLAGGSRARPRPSLGARHRRPAAVDCCWQRTTIWPAPTSRSHGRWPNTIASTCPSSVPAPSWRRGSSGDAPSDERTRVEPARRSPRHLRTGWRSDLGRACA